MANTDLQVFLDELRSRVSLTDVISAKTKLTRKGREYLGLCPFHHEKTPSFTVNEAKGFYHCFGCGAHGDIIKFEMEAGGLPFMEAVEKLANKAGMQMPQFHSQSKEEIERKASLYDIMEIAVKFFEKNLRLTGGKDALTYLYNRGFDDEIISKFRLGYAPSNNGLKALLASKGIEERDMAELGLISVSEPPQHRTFDFFRNRVIIPIFDKKGRPIGFGGRVMDSSQPKYLNSPETPIFNKRKMLYNINNAQESAFATKSLVLCEGYMDVIALDKFGFHNAVAPLGTALTEEQILEAWRMSPEPTLCFDGDNAGIKAAIRSVDRVLPLLKAGFSLKYIFLPDKMDPDELLKAKGADEFAKFLQSTLPLTDIVWQKNTENVPADTPEQKALIEKNLREEVAKIKDEQVRGFYAQDMKNRIYAAFGGKKAAGQPAKVKFIRPKTNLEERVFKFILAALILYPKLLEFFEEKLSTFDLKKDRLYEIFQAILEAFHNTESLDSETLCNFLTERGFKQDIDDLWDLKMLRQQKPEMMKIKADLQNCMLDVELKHINAEIKECMRLIDTSENIGDELLERFENLKKEKESLIIA